MGEFQFTSLRQQMVQVITLYAQLASEQLGRDTLEPSVLTAMGEVPRHEFVPLEVRPYAYADSPLPIGFGKTISQPFMVAVMTDLLDPRGDDSLLEVGTGLGYHAAVLAHLSAKVFSVEIVEELAGAARRNLGQLSYDNVEVRIGDGSRGWPEHAPFDKIVIASGVELIPPTLLEQLKPGGRMVVPAGAEDAQELTLVEKSVQGRLSTRPVMPVQFAPLERHH